MRFVRALFIALCCVAILGCWSDTPQTNQQKKGLRVGFVYVAPVGDAGWTWAHDQGRKELHELPFIAETSIAESIPEGADATRTITQFAAKGFKLIFTTSFGYMDPTLEVAQQFPDHIFMHCSGYKTADNVGTYFGRMYQARYLTGIVAGKMTKSKVIGFVAAHPIPEVIRGINAFALGVQSVNPEAEVRVVWTHTWYDPAKEREAAESLLDVGADVIAQHQDSPAPQQAAQERGKYSIGYNTDMSKFARDAHLTAPVWNWGKVYTHIAQQVEKGTWKSEKIWWGLGEGLVDIAPLHKKIGADVAQLVQQQRQKIIDGQLQVFRGPISDQQGAIKVAADTVAADEHLLEMDYFVAGVVGAIDKK